MRRLGVTTEKRSPNLTMVVHLLSPDGRYDMVYLRNYAVLHIRDELARIPGVGEAMIFGAGDYSMRIWLDPNKVAARGLTAGDVVRSIREQNVQVSAGQIGATAPAARVRLHPLGQYPGPPGHRGGVRQHYCQDRCDGEIPD